MTVGVIRVKEFDTIHIFCKYLDDDDLGINLENVSITSRISSLSGATYYSFRVEVSNKTEGEFILFLDDGVLREGTYLVDILYESSITGRRVSSDTFHVVVDKSITLGGS